MNFCLIKWHHHQGGYNQLMNEIQQESTEKFAKCHFLAKRYTMLGYGLWAIAISRLSIWYYNDGMFNVWWHYLIYITIAIFASGVESCWLTIYAYVCHIHLEEVRIYRKKVHNYEKSVSSIREMFESFIALKKKLARSQKKMHSVISLAISAHLFDMVFYTMSSFEGFYNNRELASIITYCIYMLTMSGHVITIFIKVCVYSYKLLLYMYNLRITQKLQIMASKLTTLP